MEKSLNILLCEEIKLSALDGAVTATVKPSVMDREFELSERWGNGSCDKEFSSRELEGI
jgi:hypothetical protein